MEFGAYHPGRPPFFLVFFSNQSLQIFSVLYPGRVLEKMDTILQKMGRFQADAVMAQKPAMDKKKLNQYKEKLLQAKSEILKELEGEQENFIFNDQGDLVDIADVIINNDILNSLSDLDIQKLRQIEAALEKVDNGTYGICEGTGKPIPEARLDALPWTPYTVEYAEQIEKHRKTHSFSGDFEEDAEDEND